MKKFRDTQYRVSEDGKIFNSQGKELSIKIRKEIKSNYSRAYVQLSINKRKYTFTLARIIAEVYIPNPNNLPQVNHKDGNPLNNHINNLEWCTQSYNIIHAIQTGLKPMLGENNNSAKLKYNQVKEIRNRYKNEKISIRSLAKEYNMSYTAIRYIIKGKTW